MRRVLGPAAARIEHIGSTAIPGLPGKPTIDILVGTSDLDSVGPAVVKSMADLGYQFRGEMGVPGRRYFRKGATYPRDFNVHIVELGGRLWNDDLLFRDYLRAHRSVAGEYVRLKERLVEAIKNQGATIRYDIEKASFIEQVLAGARSWDQVGRPAPRPDDDGGARA